MNNKVRILLYGSNLWHLGEGMLGPLFAVFAERIGGDILQLTSAWAVYLITMGVVMIVSGRLSDIATPVKFLLSGYFLNAVFTFGYLLVNSPMSLFIVQAGLGLAYALSAPASVLLYSKLEDKGHEAAEWGMVYGEGRILTGIAIIVGGLIVNYLSFNALFITMGTIQTIGFFNEIRILRYKKLLTKLKP